jgi:NAD(P)-dependent dehydrogenase (short-subunit alcohol dehydrogenase family)
VTEVGTIDASEAAVAPGAARLDGRVAVVTGAGARPGGVGVGCATAVALARAGASVCLVDTDSSRAEATRSRIGSEAQTLIVCGDVSRERDCAEIAARTRERFGRVDVLVNNAAILDQRAAPHELDAEHWERVIAVNLKGAVLMSKVALPDMIAAGGGSIVNISSAAGLLAAGTTAYGPAKAGLNHFTRELALAYGPNRVRVNAIAPGDIDTPMAATNQPRGAQETRAKLTPLAFTGTAWDVAALAVFLASDAARFISGAVIPVDGAASSTLVFSAFRLLSL